MKLVLLVLAIVGRGKGPEGVWTTKNNLYFIASTRYFQDKVQLPTSSREIKSELKVLELFCFNIIIIHVNML